MVLASLLIVVAAYLLGSIPTGYLIFRLFRKEDIRQSGSGNIGATNVLRSGGKGLGAATFLLDMLKGCSAVWLGALIAVMVAADHGSLLPQASLPTPTGVFCFFGLTIRKRTSPSSPSSATCSPSGSASTEARE